jgi:hypothetical protein
VLVDRDPTPVDPGEDDALPLMLNRGLPPSADGRRDAMSDHGGVTEEAPAYVIGHNLGELDAFTLPT